MELASLYYPDNDLHTPQVIATATMCLCAWAGVRYLPMRRATRYHLIALSPLVLIVIGELWIQSVSRYYYGAGYVPWIILFSFAFGFALHAMRVRHWLCRLFGVICNVWAGVRLTLIWLLIDRLADDVIHTNQYMLAALFFPTCWIVAFVLYLHIPPEQRRWAHLYPRYRWPSLWRRHRWSLRFGRREARRGPIRVGSTGIRAQRGI
ncbi:MAG: hypothetical protein GC159_07360 [Phycisphaera sp.]|nr:hypothetical protein [Phycisphaera sp.]